MPAEATQIENTAETPSTDPLSFRVFLEEFSSNSVQTVSDYYIIGANDSVWKTAPQLSLWCPDCEGYRRFDGKWTDGERVGNWKEVQRDFLTYKCRDCGTGEKTFCLLSQIREGGTGDMIKIGEYPEIYVDVPPYLRTLLADDYDYFLKGLRAEKQGLGIGAFSYYRRVVENQKGRIFQKMAEVAKRLEMPSDMIENLISASKEHQFSKALEIVKDYIPNEFKLGGQNPMKTLYAVISDGLHDKDDEACLQIAHSVRVVIQDMSQRMKDALRDDAEAKKALENLLKRHSGQI